MHPRVHPFLLAPVLGLALLPAACQAPESEREEVVVRNAQHGRFDAAVEEARRLSEAHPGDAELQMLYRDARVAAILDQGRREVLRGDLNRGLELIQQAATLDPESLVVRDWIGKTRAQLAESWLDRAAELKGPDQLDEAEQAYEKVLVYDEDNGEARSGLAHVLLLKNYRGGLSLNYYNDGLSSFRMLELPQSRREFSISLHYDENEAARVRGEEVEKMLADERLAQAQALEGSGLFFAARNEYRLVLLADPHNEGGRAGLDRMDREVRVARSLGKADMAIRRGSLADAMETLDEAGTLTEAQVDQVSLLKQGIEDKRLSDLYDEADSLTKDYRYPEAVEAYARLLEIAPGNEYHDALSRKETLEDFIHLAEHYYALAGQASGEDEVEAALRQITVVWPEYKDVAERLKAIEAHKAEKRAASEKDAPPAGDESAKADGPSGEPPAEEPRR